jgi:hypothetical protein
MTDEDLITLARRELNEDVHSVLDACEALYGHGAYDDMSGDVDAPTGHFYRVAQWIVITDAQGFHYLTAFDSEEDAENEFDKLMADYREWLGDDL